MIRLRADAVHTLQTQAQDYLDMTFPDAPILPYALRESTDKTYYHLDEAPHKELVGNLVGQGSLSNLTTDQKREIEMAFNLNPVFRAIKKNIKSVTSLYYVSESGFENYYPWKPSTKFKWDQSNLKSHFLADLSIFHLPYGNLLSWSDVYIGKEGEQLMVTCIAPIHRQEKFLGVVAINFTLKSIDELISGITNPYGRLLIVNNYETVIADTNSKSPKNAAIIKIHQILPPELKPEEVKKLPQKELSRLGKYWIFQVKSRYAPWSLIYYVPASKVLIATFEEIGPSVLFLIIFAVVILRAANSLIAQEFIHPAHKLVYLIANRAHDEEKGYKDIPDPWIPWFEEVKKVFQENQILVERLELHIKELDSMVNKRTQELSNKNKALTKALDGLKKAQNQIIVQEKLAGLGALTAGIAHEIKNPLTYIINFAELSREYITELSFLIKKNIQDQPTQATEIFYNLTHNMQRIEEHGKRADAIIRTMLMHARGKTEQLEETDLNQLVEENTLLAISGLRQQGLIPKIVKKFDPHLPHLKVYSQELGRVILNLINNSCYALYQKKTAAYEPFEPQIHLETHQDERNVIIKIWDNGPGIPEKISKNIFDPFFTTKPAGSGTGLGLSLSYEIITQQHHGTLTVNSKAGEYTEFTITLPIET
jgi:signal transduction histidine kinase